MNANFSIVIPTYNNLDLLKSALASALSQEYSSYEIIIVDDSTTNAIEEYINNENLESVRYYHNKPSLGAVKNWNYGVSLAENDYIILLHHDEYFENNFYLRNIADALSTYDVIISNVSVFTPNGAYSPGKIWLKKICAKIPPILLYGNFIGSPSVLSFKNADFIPFDEKLKWFVDIDWYIRLFQGRRVKILDNQNVCSSHGHDGQITNTIDIHLIEKEELLHIKKKYNSALVNFVIRTRAIVRIKLFRKIWKIIR